MMTRRRLPVHMALGALFVILVVAIAALLPAAWVYAAHQDRIYDDPDRVPPAPVAIVFGAGLTPDGLPSLMLADRVEAAAKLYAAGKVRRLLMTGDNSRIAYNEVGAMRDRAVALGVPRSQINLDYAGFRTCDSCYRAAAIFGVQRAVLVTQRYHLPRALFLARVFGIDATGLAAGRDGYPRQEFYNLREIAARSASWYEANVTHPLPQYLGDRVDLEHQPEP